MPRLAIPKLVVPKLPIPKIVIPSRQRTLAVIVIGLAAACVAIALDQAPFTRDAFLKADFVFYDWFYGYRPIESQRGGDVVIVAVDDKILEEIDLAFGVGWPWGRDAWHMIAEYLESCGAKVVAFDILMSERSAKGIEDDESFGALIDTTSIPLAFGRVLNKKDFTWAPFKPTISRPHEFGYVDVTSEKVYRDYVPSRGDKPSLAVATLRAAKLETRLDSGEPFLLHFYGPHRDQAGRETFPAFAASRLIFASKPDAPEVGLKPDDFKDKIVMVGRTASGTEDIKSAPNSPRMPGVEIQATAIANLLYGDAVRPVPRGFTSAVALLGAIVSASGTIGLRAALLKFITVVLLCVGVIVGSLLLFNLIHTIFWLPPMVPLFSVVLAAIGGITWSYFLEDRQARMLLKALETCLSPSVAAELAKNPHKLAVGGQQLEMTVMFTDLAGFTALTEKLKEKIEPPLNFYLGEMTEQILKANGTLDKYIGDAIMTFWNAPVDQPEHAALACEAALAVQKREREVRDQMAAMGAENTTTRIGINSGSMFVGFTGSQRKLNYTVIGDAVNLGARLEPANKIYGTQIIVSENTKRKAGSGFLFRPIDVIKVQGKKEPMPIFELLGPGELRESEVGRMARRFEQAFLLYRRMEWQKAEDILLELLATFPDDGPCQTYLGRIREFRVEPPPEDWDGVYVAKTK